MTDAKKIAALLAMHKPECVNDAMVYEVWNDGEVTLTKGGPLFRRRTLHTMEPGLFDLRRWKPHSQLAEPLPGGSLPIKMNAYSSIAVASRDEAKAASTIIKGSTFAL